MKTMLLLSPKNKQCFRLKFLRQKQIKQKQNNKSVVIFGKMENKYAGLTYKLVFHINKLYFYELM